MTAGLRIDVDTLRGTRVGVPRLLSLLNTFGVQATFFFSVGPDNMGRHIRRLLRPAFLWKMIRTGGPSLYGWDILRCGVIGLGPDIGHHCDDIIRRTVAEGHEVGLHAWDHQHWQSMDMSGRDQLLLEVRKGFDRLTEITGTEPLCSAAPAWRAPPEVFAAKRSFPFFYNSDCRGSDCFIPTDGISVFAPQVPVTLPTYDEMIGSNGVTDGNYNSTLLQFFRPDALNVLCIHAEVEGVSKASLFQDFLHTARKRDIVFSRLDEVLKSQGPLRKSVTKMESLPGRDGVMCVQGDWISED